MKLALFHRLLFWLLAISIGFYVLPTVVFHPEEVPELASNAPDSPPLSPEQALIEAAGPFPRPDGIKDAVAFWRKVFGEWRAHQIALHDNTYLGVVYEMVEITGFIGGRLSAEQQQKVDQRKTHLVAQLNDLEYRLHKHLGLSDEQQKLYALLVSKQGDSAVKGAGERLRAQRGMKESFQIGLEASSQYDALMREVFRNHQLPEGLAELPHVESAFATSARSPSGAVGVWQFMPATGRQFLRMSDAVDERYDPVLSTRGAAAYLGKAYEKLGDWALAITSYNYGFSGALRAREQFGTDIVRIIKEYDGASFGFASRNYYAEFLAVRDIMANLPKYFPKGINFQEPKQQKRIALEYAITSGELARIYGINYKALAALNPAWTQDAAEGRLALPEKLEIWLPADAKPKQEPPRYVVKHEAPALFSLLHKQSGPFVFTTHLASGWDELAKTPDNGPDWWHMGSSKRNRQPTSQPARALGKSRDTKPSQDHVTHVVQSGESPYAIASRHSVKLVELLALNEIRSGNLIRPGQILLIPPKTPSADR